MYKKYKCINHYFTFKILSSLFCQTRYELAQQLQPQSTEDHLGGGAVAHDIQVEIEGDSLQQPPATSAEQQSMLGLGQTEVVNGSQQVTLEAPLTDQPLVQGEGKQRGDQGRDTMDVITEQAYQVQVQGHWTRAAV